eukprot:15366893-Ditylum_brightwellii.AAC.1
MHIGMDGMYKGSKTKAISFPPPRMASSTFDMSPIPVMADGYVNYCKKFEYLGSYVTDKLNGTFDIKIKSYRLPRLQIP